MVKKTIIFILMLLLIMPTIIKAKEVAVGSQSELLEAIQDKDVDTITLSKDIETTQKINITRPLVIDGKNHTIKYVGTFGTDNSKSNTVWGGIYVLQFYKTTGTIRNIKLTGGNAALLLNGSQVKLEGTIDVSGNGFGGIELGQGVNVDEDVKLTLDDNINIINTTEKNSAPTLWVASDSEDATITMNGVTKILKKGEELKIKEIEKILGMDIEANPNTSDNISLYITLFMISLIGITSTIKFSKKEC